MYFSFMQTRYKILLFCFVALLSIICDRFTKHLAQEHLMNRPPITYLHNTVVLEYAENTGAALSLGDSLPKTTGFWTLSIMPLTLMLALLYYVVRNAGQLNSAKIVCLALVFSGGIGNLIDRIFSDRHVVDFMNIGIQNLRTGIFNVADVCITAGAIGMLIFFRDKKPSATALITSINLHNEQANPGIEN